jgi:RimJ/RimL family protein N-acetyltransferase
MTTLEELWPLFRLRVCCGPLELRLVRDTDLPEVVAAVQGGIHDPARMPFLHPWTDASGDALVRQTMQHFWQSRAEATPEKWSLELGVWRDGTFVGIQAVSTRDFAVTRTGETGSWLGLPFQGRGTGTLMRQAVCALCFDHLGFTEVTSGAFTDNPQSMAVSTKVGYVPNGLVRFKRRGALAVNRQLRLTPEAFVRAEHPVEVTGVDGVRRMLGIEVVHPDNA